MNSFRFKLMLIVCGIIIAAAGAAAVDQEISPPEKFRETMTPFGRGITGEEIFFNSITVSPDLKHLAYVSRVGQFFRVWHNGVAEQTYQDISRDSPYFSPKNNRLAFVVQEGEQMYAVVDNMAQKKYAKVGAVTFSPDGSRFAYRAENNDGEQFVVIDDKQGPSFEIGIPHTVGIVFSPDASQAAYIGIERDGSQTLVLNNKKTGNYSEIKSILFSPDSRHYALICRQDQDWLVVRDGRRGKRYQQIGSLVFSPDSKHIAYEARRGRKSIVVKDNREYDQGQGSVRPVFSPDGKRFAYITMDKERNVRYIIDDNRGPVIGRPGQLTFSRDSSRVAYGAWISGKWYIFTDGEKGPAFDELVFFSFSPHNSDLIYSAKTKEGKAIIVVNDQQGKMYDSVGIPVFSPDRESLAHAASDENKMIMVVNGQEGKRYPIIGIPSQTEKGQPIFTAQYPVFSGDGSRMAYPVFSPEDKQAFMVVDGKEHQPFDAIGKPHFSPDGTHIVYTAVEDGQTLVVVDGHPGQTRVDGIIKGADIHFDTDNRCYLLVARQTDPGPSFFRLEVEIINRPEYDNPDR